MIAKLLICLALSGQIVASPRLREALPNGATVFVEAMPKAKAFSLQLVVSSRGAEETAETAGLRHLLEHLVVRSPERQYDARLEDKGLFLFAATSREATRINITGQPEYLDLALRVMSEILEPPKITEADIAKEVLTLQEELTLEPPRASVTAEVWSRMFEGARPDPRGNLSVMRAATPERLLEIFERTFSPGNAVLLAAGPTPLEATLDKLRTLMLGMKTFGGGVLDQTAATRPYLRTSRDGFEAAAVATSGLGSKSTLATHAAGLALASLDPSARYGFTLSARPALGVLSFGVTRSSHLSEAASVYRPNLYQIGKGLFSGWLDEQMSNPSSLTSLWGLLLSQPGAPRPDTLRSLIAEVDEALFYKALDEFRLVGSRD